MRNAQGNATISSPDGVAEADTFTCFHCQKVTHVKAKMDPSDLGGLCKVCMRLICSRCVGGTCVPLRHASAAPVCRYDMPQTAALLDAVRETRLFVPTMLAVLCGLRRGEPSPYPPP